MMSINGLKALGINIKEEFSKEKITNYLKYFSLLILCSSKVLA